MICQCLADHDILLNLVQELLIIVCLFFIRSFQLLVTRMPAFIFNGIFLAPIECVSSCSVSRVTFFHAKLSRLFSSFIVLRAGSKYVVSSMILQMFSMGLRSGEFAGQPSLAIKFGKFFWHQVWAAFEVWAGAPSWTNVISFLELNNFLSIGPPVTWRFDAKRFHFFLKDLVDVVLRS